MKATSVEEELKKNPEIKREQITALQKWCESQSNLPDMTERDLVIFFQSCYFNVESTKLCIENYFKIRSKHPTYFSNRDPESVPVKKAFSVTGYYLLNGYTAEGYRVIFSRLIKTSPSEYVFNDALKVYNMVADAVFNTEGSCAGDLIVYDMAGTSFGHLTKLNVGGFKHMLSYVQEGLPVRLKGIYMINSIPFVDVVINMMTPFMKKELLDMFHVTTSSDVLNSLMPAEMIPKEYGGQGKSLPELHAETLSLIQSQRDFYLADDKRRMLSPSKTEDKQAGRKSSLRRLELD